MKEVKPSKKPLAIYYAIVLVVLLVLNFVFVPWLTERQVKEVDYGTFMTMTEEQNIGRSQLLQRNCGARLASAELPGLVRFAHPAVLVHRQPNE